MMLSQAELLERLHRDVVTVRFLKADGSTRVMLATLRNSLLPPLVEGKQTASTQAEQNSDLVRVWDTEAKAWRSFRYSRVIETT